jgi:phosphoserine phosphatase RsbU/P
MMDSTDALWHDVLVTLLDTTQQAPPDDVARAINASVAPLGMGITCYLVDHEQCRLHPLPVPGRPQPPALNVEGTTAGRAFTSVTTHPAGGAEGPRRLWVPLVDGSERLGVVDLVIEHAVPGQDDLQQRCETLVNLVGHLLAAKLPYGDLLHQVRRTSPMPPAGELLSAMLPPLTFSCHRMVISAVLEPCYNVGGDVFDYAVDSSHARFLILDAMGRGLSAGLTAVAALAAIRAARRDRQGLYAMARAADDAITEQFHPRRFVTGVLAELNLDTGLLRYINAGHPFPLLLRGSKAVRELTAGRRLPLGLDDAVVEVGEELLEPGDRLLLFTDGVVEARDAQGQLFGSDRLVDLAERAAVSQLPAPETLRRLSHLVLQHQIGPPRDDATMMLVEWSADAAHRVVPHMTHRPARTGVDIAPA